MTDNETLALDDVARLFAESVTVLEEARERLDQLATAEERAEAASKAKAAAAKANTASAKATAAAAERVAEFTESAREAADLLAKAAADTGKLLQAAGAVLDDSQLAKLGVSVDHVSKGVEDLRRDTNDRLEDLANSIERIDGEQRKLLIAEKEELEKERDERLGQLIHVRAVLKPRAFEKVQREMPGRPF